MDLKKVKVSVTMATTWERAKRTALATEGKIMKTPPTDVWIEKMIRSEHSPIRMVEYDITIENVPQWVTTHLVRHHIGCEKFVASQRTDRNADIKCDRDDLPQGELNTMTFVANAQALINISRLRLCGKASYETRCVWAMVVNAIKEVDPILYKYLVPNCVYRGLCPEPKCCGYYGTSGYNEKRAEYKALYEKTTE